MLIIGSTALQMNGIAPQRPVSDTDIICTQEAYQGFLDAAGDQIVDSYPNKRGNGFVVHQLGFKPFEFEIAGPGSTAELLLQIIAEHDLSITVDGKTYAKPAIVYALKMSHRYLKNSPYFRKTMDDIHYLRSLGYSEIIPVLRDFNGRDWYKERMKETYSYSHPNLNQSSVNFFKDDNIPYTYDHDTIHEAVKHFDRPAFEYIKKDAAEVFCSKEKFMEADEEIKLATVLEESYVLALERHQIPNNFAPDPKTSFLIALEKVCTSIASGWWREYAWENYHKVRALYSEDYVDRFHQGLIEGIVRPFRKQEAA